MSKSNPVVASGIVLALVLAASVTQAAEPVTFTQTIQPATADRSNLQARNGANQDLGGWAKADGLKVTWDVVEYRSSITKPPQTETLEIAHAGFRDVHSSLAALESAHAGLRRNDIALEAITIQHEGLPKPQAAFNPKELPVEKSVPWIRNAQPHTSGAVGGDSFNGKYLISGVTHR